MSPGVSLIPSICEIANINQFYDASRKAFRIDLPFLEIDSCTASKQEHIISVVRLQFFTNLIRYFLDEFIVIIVKVPHYLLHFSIS